MGWLDTPEQNKQQHLQMFATGNIKEIDRIHERTRRRKINSILWILFIISGVFGFLSLKYDHKGYWLIGLSLLFLIILIFRYGLHRKIKIKKRSKGWEKLDRLPDWAYKKMKRRKKNVVNGDHYVYKRDGNKFYKKRK